MSDVLALTRDLIARSSVTPDDAGCQALLAERLARLPRGKDFVAYCRGPYCTYADRAVQLLVASGRRARRLSEGFPEWKAAGYPIASAAQESP